VRESAKISESRPVPVKTIGILGFRKEPVEVMDPPRTRAMLAEAALQGAELVFLDALQYDLAAGRVRTMVWKADEWREEWRGPPDVVTIIGSPLEAGHEPLDAWIRRSCPVIVYTNDDKLAQSEILSGTPCACYLIPQARVPAEAPGEMLADFLRTHHGAVIKRVDGSRGVGLLFIVRETGGWTVKYKGKEHRGTLEEAAGFVASRIAGRLRYRQFVAQRFIRSVAADGRAADIRVHVQRGGDGEFGVTRGYARLAEAGIPLANTSRGGYQGPIEGFLSQRAVRDPGEIEDELKRVALEIAEIQSATHETPLAELGIDFLIDDDDRIWIVETNVFPGSYLHEQLRAERAVGYALHVAEKAGRAGE